MSNPDVSARLRKFVVRLTQEIAVYLDEAAFTPEFMAEFDAMIQPGFTLEDHAKHLAWVHGTGVEVIGGYGSFIEGYGPAKDMCLSAEVLSTETEIESVTP